MELRPEEARVLACLVEKETSTPEQYPLTLNALRLACNQTTNRDPVVAYDDRTVEAALLQLKATGLVRFVLPGAGTRTTRYRHTADERWKLSSAELAVLAGLVLRGPQTAGECRAKAPAGTAVDEVLDTLAARSPEPFAERIERRPGEREPRWRHLLTVSEPESRAGGTRPAEMSSLPAMRLTIAAAIHARWGHRVDDLIHTHAWTVGAVVEGPADAARVMPADELEHVLAETVRQWNGHYLTDVDLGPWKGYEPIVWDREPTVEEIVRRLWAELDGRIAGLREVSLEESSEFDRCRTVRLARL